MFSYHLGSRLAPSGMVRQVEMAKLQLHRFFGRGCCATFDALSCRVFCEAHSKSSWQISSIETLLKPGTRRRHARTLLFFWVSTDTTWPPPSFCLVSQAPTTIKICSAAPAIWHDKLEKHLAVSWCFGKHVGNPWLWVMQSFKW